MLIIAPFFYGDFMQLVLYKNSSPDNAINKVLSGGTVFNINFRGEVDIINPSLPLVRLTGIDFREYNYAEITELGRFYFIDSIDSTNARIETLNLRTDVLETYKQDILNSYAVFNKKLEAGDYGEVSISLTGETEVSNYSSNVTLEKFDNSLFSVLRWA